MESALRVGSAVPGLCQLCALALLISAGNALQCIECRDFSEKECTGQSVTCSAASDVCLSTLVQYETDTSNPASQSVLQSIGPRPPRVFVRGCGYSEECTDVVVLRTPYNRMVTSNNCCKSDFCSPGKHTAIAEASDNGLTCPGCFHFTSEACRDFTTVRCRGSESQCFSYSDLHLDENVSIAMAGCATQTACNVDLQQDKKKTLCTGGNINGGQTIHISLLLIAACLLLKYV